MNRSATVVLAMAAIAAATAPIHAQSRSAQAKSVPPASPDAPRASNSGIAPNRVSVVPLNLQRDVVKSVQSQMGNGGGRSKPSLSDGLRSTLSGNKERIEAAKRVLTQAAQTSRNDSDTTVVVVIGTESDRDRVVESLAQVSRAVRVAFVDKALQDATFDNTALGSGLAGSLVDATNNVWVFLPRRGAPPRLKPDNVTASRAAVATYWNALFTRDGDALNVGQVRGAVSRSNASAETNEPNSGNGNVVATAPAQSATTASGIPGINIGDVVGLKLDGVKMYADAVTTSKVVRSTKKNDDFVVAEAAKNGMVRVDGANESGWVNANLVTKR